jgi:hypothetical protein
VRPHLVLGLVFEVLEILEHFDAIKSVVVDGSTLLAFSMAAAKNSGSDNAANPAWRNTCVHAIQGRLLGRCCRRAHDRGHEQEDDVRLHAAVEGVSPGAGAFMSEADILEPDFQQAFYGLPMQNGRLCRA